MHAIEGRIDHDGVLACLLPAIANLILCNTYKLSEMYCNNFSVPNKKGKKQQLEMGEENVP